MPEIITVTLNPALDVSTSVDTLLPSRKLKCADPVNEPGGGGINVARAIKNLGGKALALYLSGGDSGREIGRSLNRKMIDTLEVPIKGITRQNLVVADRATDKQYLFVMPGVRLNKAECRDCLQAIDQLNGFKFLVLSGSLPKGCPPDMIKKLALLARRKKAKFIVDSSGEVLQQAAQAGAFLIKPNLKELGFMTGRPGLDAGKAAAAAHDFLINSRCEAIVVSLGGQGALLVTKEYSLEVPAPAVEVLSTVGAGDSLLAGIVFKLLQNKSLAEAVKYGVACGTAATLQPGTQLCRKADADRLFRLM
ncbi:1-phosphofructokinase family hexose kinase [Mucilaginibacter aquariorum]|uniref:1-phosphofructokinase family hexose kinase n=1 Tax=Mucilaginibacter aquariorum TaxID=2967225 RepID=A0ABT1T3A2_9SPHI|nr:1-phosphofructokinase family hexose kinase [Mucilaginibacter aquariorum]MCQ6958746.1 1-phosphofructokinase family hexose kinase [Mucilaginibacter aquariorum]